MDRQASRDFLDQRISKKFFFEEVEKDDENLLFIYNSKAWKLIYCNIIFFAILLSQVIAKTYYLFKYSCNGNTVNVQSSVLMTLY